MNIADEIKSLQLRIAEIKEVRAARAQAYANYMAPDMTMDTFERIKSRVPELSIELRKFFSKAQRHLPKTGLSAFIYKPQSPQDLRDLEVLRSSVVYTLVAYHIKERSALETKR